MGPLPGVKDDACVLHFFIFIVLGVPKRSICEWGTCERECWRSVRLPFDITPPGRTPTIPFPSSQPSLYDGLVLLRSWSTHQLRPLTPTEHEMEQSEVDLLELIRLGLGLSSARPPRTCSKSCSGAGTRWRRRRSWIMGWVRARGVSSRKGKGGDGWKAKNPAMFTLGYSLRPGLRLR